MAKRHATKSRRAKDKDPYRAAIGEVWDVITLAYNDFKDEKPVVEYLLPRGIIYSYPALDYVNDLTERTREQARQLYLRASEEGKFLVFVRDTQKRVLRSYVFPIDDRP